MSSPESGTPNYTVTVSGQIRQQIELLQVRKALQRQRESFLDALPAIMIRLESDPDVFGEPLYHLTQSQLEVRRGAIAPILVMYGVNLQARQVFVKNIHLLP